jgi:hypothetical protein
MAGAFRGVVPDVPKEHESDPKSPQSVPAWEYEDRDEIKVFYVNPVKFIPEEAWSFLDEYVYRKNNSQMPEYNQCPARFIDACNHFESFLKFWSKPIKKGFS